jgi:hypothetical protein
VLRGSNDHDLLAAEHVGGHVGAMASHSRVNSGGLHAVVLGFAWPVPVRVRVRRGLAR